jgi:hypothetical protein
MVVLHGQVLVTKLRTISDKVKNKLWIAVPYIGSPSTIRRVLGKNWFNNPSVSLKLITDTSDLSGIDLEMLNIFHSKGSIKTLLGLHAKIYIIDETCIITSANLTNTAFTKRHEIGLWLNAEETVKVKETFDLWWKMATNIKPEVFNKVIPKKKTSKEGGKNQLQHIFNLPKDPGQFLKISNGGKFLNYERLLNDYSDFAKKYKSIQRIWPEQPLYFEIDGLLNYLYSCGEMPSKKYSNKEPQNLTSLAQFSQLTKWAKKFKGWSDLQINNSTRVEDSKFIKSKLSIKKIGKLTLEEVRQVLLKTNAGKSRVSNCDMVINENKIQDIRFALNKLVNAHELPLPQRFTLCNNIKGLGSSMMNELLGYCYPEDYPIINSRSNCSLKFFGYKI